MYLHFNIKYLLKIITNLNRRTKSAQKNKKSLRVNRYFCHHYFPLILNKFIILTLFLYISPSAINATTHILILVSTPNAKETRYRHLHTVKNIVAAVESYNVRQAEESDQCTIKIFAQGDSKPNHDWILYNDAVKGPLRERGPLKEAFLSIDVLRAEIFRIKLEAIKANSRQKQKILIVITGHGYNDNEKDSIQIKNLSEASGFFHWCHDGSPPQVPFSVLADQLEDLTSQNTSISILCLTCSSGGVHDITQKMDYLCSASTSPFCMVTVSRPEGAPFSESFFNSLLQNIDHNLPVRTFAEAAIDGYQNDPLNVHLGSLSSTTLMNSIVGAGPYSQNAIELMNGNHEITRGANYTNNKDFVPIPDYVVFSACDHAAQVCGQPPLIKPPHGNADSNPVHIPLLWPTHKLVDFLRGARRGAQKAEFLDQKFQAMNQVIEDVATVISSQRLKVPDHFLNMLRNEVAEFNQEVSRMTNDHSLKLKIQNLNTYTVRLNFFFQKIIKFKRYENLYFIAQTKYLKLARELTALNSQSKKLSERVRAWILFKTGKENQWISTMERLALECDTKKELVDDILKQLASIQIELRESYNTLLANPDQGLFYFAQTLHRIDGLRTFFLDPNSPILPQGRDRLINILHTEWENF